MASTHIPTEKYHFALSKLHSKMSKIEPIPSTPPIITSDGSKNASKATEVHKLAANSIAICFKLYKNLFFFI